MKQRSNILTAIDIGTTKIVTLVGRLNDNGQLEIIGMSKTPSKGVKRGAVLNIEEAVSAIRFTVEEVQKQVGFPIREAYVGIAGQHIKSLRNRGYIMRDSYEDEITQEDTDRLLAEMYKISIQPGEEIIHVLPQNYMVDHETGVKNPIGMFGKRLEGNYHIVIGQTTSARTIERCVNRVGIKVRQMILEPLASSAAVLTEDEIEAGVALVDIGGGTTDVAVYYDDIIKHTAVIPFGGNVITKDVMEGCSILNKHAEQLKIQYGSALGDLAEEGKVVAVPGISGREPKEVSIKSLAYIIQARMEEIINAVVYQLEESDCYEKLTAGIVITGGGSMLKHLPQLVNYRTGLDVRIGKPNVQISGNDLKEVNHPMYSTSVGLLLKGFENAIPEPVQEFKKEEDVPEFIEETEKTSKHSKSFGEIFEQFKTSIGGFFDDQTDKNM
ncbi:MAG TPA: cell division protein FtsA [Bacteroidales bacterium]|nr:cell division protein FtsA [Bacteroidales bacterium]